MDDELQTTPEETTSIETKKRSSGSRSGGSSSSKKKSTKKGVNGDMSSKELQTGFHYLFKIIVMVRRSKTEFVEDEFKELAGAYLNLANRFPILKLAFLALAPLATVGELVDKLRRVEKGVEKKPKQKPGTVVDMATQEGGVYGAAGSGFTTTG